MESVVTFLQDVVPQVSVCVFSEIVGFTIGQESSEMFCFLNLKLVSSASERHGVLTS